MVWHLSNVPCDCLLAGLQESLPKDAPPSIGIDVEFALTFGNDYIYESNHINCLANHSG